MNREKKTGVVLIIIGICLPLVFLPFLSGYEKDRGIIENFLKIGIVVKKEKPVSADKMAPSSMAKILPARFPYRFILAFGIFLIFAGFVKIDLIRRRDINHKQ
ncbi:MAG: hypothetical protein C0399_08240 [Syntrophus sp. (in: bacteria)]|nr:hypothetical protein [Syntrophus sp. (in: bacteria)]